MSGQMLKEAAASVAERWNEAADQFGEAFARFRESRLYVQVVLSAVMVGVTGLVALAPLGPLARVKETLTWVVVHDHDFAGQAGRAHGWAQRRGGWVRAFAGVWTAGLTSTRDWVGLPNPGSDPSPSQSQGQQSQAQDKPAQDLERSPSKPIMPVDGALLFGFGWPPPGSGDQFHHGIDLVAAKGTKVVAILDGSVVNVTADATLGRLVEVRHDTLLAVYAQVESVAVKPGEQVRQGQTLALVAASSGAERSEPPHLHFEVRILPERHSVDPASYLGLGGSKL